MAFPNWIKRLNGWLERIAENNKPRVERVLGRLPNQEDVEVVDFATDADLAMLRQEPLRARVLLRAIGIVFLIFILWAAVARLDEVTRGEGKVIPSKQLQVLQSIDGGLVSEILVHEGDVVQPEQLLVKIDETRFQSSVNENRAQYLSHLAKVARLKAVSEGTDFVPPEEAVKESPEIVAQEQQLYLATRDELTAALSIAQQQLAVQVFHPARQQAGLVGAQHLGAGRVDAPGLGLLAVKGVHHQGACRLAAQRFHPWDGLLHLLGQCGQTQGWAGAVGSGLRKLCGVASQGL